MSGVQIAGMDGLLAKLKAMPAAINASVAAEIQDGAQAIAAEAKSRAPGNLGLLRNSIAAIKTDPLSWQVVAGAEYAPYVEFGTRGKVEIPPGLESYAAQFKGDGGATGGLSAKEAIFAWCQDKGIDPKLWYPIYISIMTNGTEPQPFFFPAAYRNEPIIIDRISKALEDAV